MYQTIENTCQKYKINVAKLNVLFVAATNLQKKKNLKYTFDTLYSLRSLGNITKLHLSFFFGVIKSV